MSTRILRWLKDRIYGKTITLSDGSMWRLNPRAVMGPQLPWTIQKDDMVRLTTINEMVENGDIAPVMPNGKDKA